MSLLRETVLNFEKILPHRSWKRITTCFNHEYGELHRVYYDECDLDKEDLELLKVVEPFVNRTDMTITPHDPEVKDLRTYLTGNAPAAFIETVSGSNFKFTELFEEAGLESPA